MMGVLIQSRAYVCVLSMSQVTSKAVDFLVDLVWKSVSESYIHSVLWTLSARSVAYCVAMCQCHDRPSTTSQPVMQGIHKMKLL